MAISRPKIGKQVTPKLGSGKRFAKLATETGSPALAAWIGRKKYGDKKFQKLSARGKNRTST